jgi:hypothetical protein
MNIGWLVSLPRNDLPRFVYRYAGEFRDACGRHSFPLVASYLKEIFQFLAC